MVILNATAIPQIRFTLGEFLQGTSHLDLIANQIFGSTVTRYHHPGDNLNDPWEAEVIIRGLTSPSDMWLADMDGDGLVDVVSAEYNDDIGLGLLDEVDILMYGIGCTLIPFFTRGRRSAWTTNTRAPQSSMM